MLQFVTGNINRNMKIFKDITYFEDMKLDIYTPDKPGFKTIINYHGGGFVEGDKEYTKYLADQFVAKGYCFVAVNYTMYPKVRFPQYLIEGAHSVKYVLEHIKEYGGTGEVYVSGQSAGAWLTLMLCLNRKYLDDIGINVNDVAGWISDSAQTTSHFNIMKQEKGVDSRFQRIDEYAPMFYIDDETTFRRMLLITYDNDMPCRMEQNQLFYKALLAINSSIDVTLCIWPGEHCAGAAKADENGEYRFVNDSIKWIESK